MRTMRSIIAGLGVGLFLGAALAFVLVPLTPLLAQITQTQSFQRAPQPRSFQTQQTHYMRFVINFASCTPSTGLTCFVRVGAVPYNSFLTAVHWQTTTTYSGNSVSVLNIGLGVSAGATTVPNQLILAATNMITATTTQNLITNFVGSGVDAVGNAAVINPPPTILLTGGTQTSNLVVPATGGFDIYATITATTGYPTAGQTTIVLEYIAPNDGSCQPFLIDQAITAVAPFTAC
jgi:hypothetical protein